MSEPDDDEAPAPETVAPEPAHRVAVPTRASLVGVEFEVALRGLNAAWREVKDTDTPTLLQLVAAGGAARVDAELNAGYLAVRTAEDTWRVFNFRRDLMAITIAALTELREEDVRAALAKGPSRFERVTAPTDAPAAE